MGDLEILVPICAIGLPMVVAITSILVKHQQKMAELIHSRSEPQPQSEELAQIRRDIESLSDRLNQVVLALESNGAPQQSPLEQRLSQD